MPSALYYDHKTRIAPCGNDIPSIFADAEINQALCVCAQNGLPAILRNNNADTTLCVQGADGHFRLHARSLSK
jgi:hypothetical protein